MSEEQSRTADVQPGEGWNSVPVLHESNGDSAAYLDFTDLAPIEVPVRVGGKVVYVLREADGDAAEKFRAANVRGVEFTHHGDSDDRTFKNLSGSVSSGYELLAKCLYRASPDGTLPTTGGRDGSEEPDRRFLVSPTAVRMLPSKMRDQLVARLKEISHLDEADTLPALRKQRDRLDRQIAKLEAAEQLAKKSSSGGRDGSDCATD